MGIRTAKAWGKRPTQVLTGDPHYGNRDYHGEPTGENEWTRWDFVLANTIQTIEDLTDQNGLAVWVKENPRVDITADAKVDKFERAKGEKQELAGKNTKVKKHGVYYVPNIVVMDGEYPTLSEWYESKREE